MIFDNLNVIIVGYDFAKVKLILDMVHTESEEATTPSSLEELEAQTGRWEDYGHDWVSRTLYFTTFQNVPAYQSVDYKYKSGGYEYWVKGTIPIFNKTGSGANLTVLYAGYVNKKIWAVYN